MNTSTSLGSAPTRLPAPDPDRTVESAGQERHEHAWVTASRHATSEGIILYVRCACGAWRVDTVDAPAADGRGGEPGRSGERVRADTSTRPPRALSRTLLQ